MLRSSCNEFSRVIAHPLCTLWSLEKIGLNSCARILPASATLQLQAWIISHVCRLISVTKIRYRLLWTTLNNTSKTLIWQVGVALIVEPLRNPRKRTALQHVTIFSGCNSNVLPHITRRGLRFKRGRHIYAITSVVKNSSKFSMFNIDRSHEYITVALLWTMAIIFVYAVMNILEAIGGITMTPRDAWNGPQTILTKVLVFTCPSLRVVEFTSPQFNLQQSVLGVRFSKHGVRRSKYKWKGENSKRKHTSEQKKRSRKEKTEKRKRKIKREWEEKG